MYAYQNPGPTQTTNIRVNSAIENLLKGKDPVDIFILDHNGLLSYGGFKINLAAGLEDTLIYEINPVWNLTGKNSTSVENQDESENFDEAIIEPDFSMTANKTLEIKLGSAYYNQGFFNINMANSGRFGNDNSTIEIQLGFKPIKIITGYINRTANTNGTPRIMGGKELKDWIQNNFQFNELMKVDIFSPVSIRLYKD
jgi:hypothetical protein